MSRVLSTYFVLIEALMFQSCSVATWEASPWSSTTAESLLVRTTCTLWAYMWATTAIPFHRGFFLTYMRLRRRAARRAAPITFRVPTTAGRTSSCTGSAAVMATGDARWNTTSHPYTNSFTTRKGTQETAISIGRYLNHVVKATVLHQVRLYNHQPRILPSCTSVCQPPHTPHRTDTHHAARHRPCLLDGAISSVQHGFAARRGISC